jgi:hypothetical protein
MTASMVQVEVLTVRNDERARSANRDGPQAAVDHHLTEIPL